MALVRPTMPATAPAVKVPVSLPNEDELREIIVGLLDRRTIVHRNWGEFAAPSAGEVALFVDDDGELAALSWADVGFAAASAAALALVPVDKVQTALQENRLDDMLRDNYYEVINILSSLLNANPERHVRLTTTHRIGEDVPPGVEARAAGARAHSFNVEIDGYGSGEVHFLAL